MTTRATKPLPQSRLSHFIRSNQVLNAALPSVEDAYRAGRDYHRNGPDEGNCHFRLFATPAHTRAWEKGKADAAAGR